MKQPERQPEKQQKKKKPVKQQQQKKKKRPRVDLTIDQKLAICRHKAANPTLTEEQVSSWAAEQFKLPHPPHRSTIGRILDDKEQWESTLASKGVGDQKRRRSGKFPKLEEALVIWLNQVSRHLVDCLL